MDLSLINAFAITGLLILMSSVATTLWMFLQRRKWLHITWGVFCFSIAIWGLGVYQIATARSPESALLWWKAAYTGVIFIPILFVHFVHMFLQLNRRWVTYSLYALGTFYLIANLFTDVFIRDVRHVFSEFYYLSPTPLYNLFVAFFFALVAYAHIRLFIAMRWAEGTRKLQLQYIFFGPLVGFIGGSFSFLPVYGLDVYPYLNVAIFVGMLSVGYAIVRHKLLDIKVVATQLFVIFLWVFIFTRVVLSPLGSQEQLINGTLLLFTVVIGFLLVRSVMKEVRQREAIEELNGKLKQANEQLEVLLNVKNEFLQIASHQLRTPVSVMRGMLDMMREGKRSLTPEQREEMVQRAYLKSKKLNQVIDDVLSATEMDVPSFDVSGTAHLVDLKALAQKAVDSHKDEAVGKRLTLTLQAAEKVPKVNASETYLPQAMTNLIDNAIKYTKEGSVTVKVYPEDGTVVFAVQDTGIGVPEKDMQNLWTKFKRASNAKDMHTDGSGLGLFIIKKIVEAHPGGTVFVESKEGQGSTFSFKLPMIKQT